MNDDISFQLNIGDTIRTSYGTGPYIITKIIGPCTCPKYLDCISGRENILSALHYHIICNKNKHEFYLNGFASIDGKIKSVWNDDEIYIVENQPVQQLHMF